MFKRGRSGRGGAVILSTLLATLLVAPVASAQTSSDDVVEASIVQTVTEWKGYIQYPDGDGGLDWSGEETTYVGCSGFFASGSGHVATAGHCVDPAEGRKALIRAFFTGLLEKGLSQAAVDALLPEALTSWKVEGEGTDGPIVRQVRVTQPIGIGAVLSDDTPVAQVVDFRPAGESDLALLKLNLEGTPTLPIADYKPEVGTEVQAIGFPAAVSDAVDALRARASSKDGTISSQQTTNDGVPVTEINADVNEGMSGGPTVDKETGGVVGINSFRANNEGGQAFNFITDQGELVSFLNKNGVEMKVASRGWSVWLIIVVIGGAAVLVVGLLFLLVRRIQKARGTSTRAELSSEQPTARLTVCNHADNSDDAKFCSQCGAPLPPQ